MTGFGGRTYRAVGRRINANPLTRETGEGRITSMGFPFCDVSDYVDEEVASDLAQFLNKAEAELAALRAQNEALREAASIAADELECFVDFAVRQCEFEGDEVAGYEAVKALRNALAQVAK